MTRNKLLSMMLLTFLLSTISFGRFMLPTVAPVDRLIKNTTAYINENPQDTNAYYTLGRIHYLAFVNKSGLIGVYESEALPRIPQDWLQQSAISQNLYNHAREIVMKEYGYASDGDIPVINVLNLITQYKTREWNSNSRNGLQRNLKMTSFMNMQITQ